MRKIGGLLLILSLWACKKQPEHNYLTEQEQKEGWTLLFDGETLNGWHTYLESKVIDNASWVVREGELKCLGSDSSSYVKGDLVTNKEYENYELTFDWKIDEEANSGVFINVFETPDVATTWASGPEYQLLDVNHPDYAHNELKRPGCLYNFQKQLNKPEEKKAGEWNTSRIVQNQGKVQFYLNGVLTAEEDFTSEEWKSKLAGSSFKDFPEFGKRAKGKIALQDWYRGIAFRNMKIKEI